MNFYFCVLIKIIGLPRDLKMSEAKPLGAFLMTLCEDYELYE